MIDYSKMSDFEINCLVAEMVGHRPLSAELGYAGLQEEGDITAAIVRGKNRIGAFSPCNNPTDAWPIIVDNGIGVSPGKENPFAWDLSGGILRGIKYSDNNTLRAAMIVFLMMKASE